MPVTRAFKEGKAEITPEAKPETIASTIRIEDPVNAKKALHAIRSSGGTAESVTDEEIIAAQIELARSEGIGVEPASAAPIAGLKKLVEIGVIECDERIVCIATGHLLKDPERATEICEPPKEVETDVKVVRKMLKGV